MQALEKYIHKDGAPVHRNYLLFTNITAHLKQANYSIKHSYMKVTQISIQIQVYTFSNTPCMITKILLL